MLIDATGKVVFDGHPSSITPDLIEKATAGAMKKPLWELPKPFAKVRAAVAKGDLAGALKEAETLKAQPNAPEEAATVADAVKSMITGALAGADAMATAEDYLGAQKEYERLTKAAKGLPEEATAKEKLAGFAKDEKIKKSIAAQKDLEKIVQMTVKSKKDAIEKKTALEAFIKKHEGKYAAKKAQEALAPIEASLQKAK